MDTITLEKLLKARKIHAKHSNKFFAESKEVYSLDVFLTSSNFDHYKARKRWGYFATRGYDCCYCGLKGTHVVVWYDHPDMLPSGVHVDLAHCDENGVMTMITIDHVTPKSKGGHDHIDNVVTACSPCNAAKGNNILIVK